MRICVLIGAARSGTKVLRDSLATASDVIAVPYDINFVWRFGNENSLDDVLTVGDLQSAKVRKVRSYLERLSGQSLLVEKTVANGLRIPFVDGVVPEAQYVYLVRDPVDVVESAMRQWLSPTDSRYALRKALSFPWRDAAGYGTRQLAYFVRRRTRKSEVVPPWGPVYPGLAADLENRRPIIEVCAEQWRMCNEYALEGFDQVGKSPAVIHYERLCAEPEDTLSGLADRLGVKVPAERASRAIRGSAIGRGLTVLDPEQVRRVREMTGPTYDAIRFRFGEAR